MFLKVNHVKLEVYQVAGELIHNCYRLSTHFPAEEKFNLIQQLKRAAISVKLNIAEGSSRKSELERKRFFEIARGSLIEIDSIFEIASQLKYLKSSDLESSGIILNRCFAMISKMI